MNTKALDLLKQRDYIVPRFLIEKYKILGISSDNVILLIYLINQNKPIICDYQKIATDLNIDLMEVMTRITELKTSKLIEVELKKNVLSKIEEYISLDLLYNKVFLNFIDEIEDNEKHYYFIGEEELFNDVAPISPIERDLVAEYLVIDDDYSYYYDVKEEQLGKPYYIPEKSKFLLYENEEYHEKTLSFISLRAFFRNQASLSKENADEIVEDICCMSNVYNGNIKDIVHALDYCFSFTKSLLKEFIPLYEDMFNDTRLHIHCGHTPNEILEITF